MLGKRISAGFIAMAAMAGVIAAAPSAAAVDRTCYDGNFCIYKDSNYSTNNSMYRTKYESARWDIDMPAVYEADSSWWNRRGQSSKTYGGRWMSWGVEICLVPGGSVNYYWDANDDGASNTLNDGNGC
ncbi:peptidase inhibitor family I36 protein [Streptomyces sp. DSM 40907]|uniref:peptidase inhibitor family I36 protein n=1 Tax=Streptomyces kutzneri TaxID=3051179 RepID=UPI0028D154A2|nr:peptidase inhibitor family I36 protein [Streptomyces sp. DSM 40907]